MWMWWFANFKSLEQPLKKNIQMNTAQESIHKLKGKTNKQKNPSNLKQIRKSEAEQWKNRGVKQKTNNEMVDLNPYISIIILNINSLNIPVKRQRLIE